MYKFSGVWSYNLATEYFILRAKYEFYKSTSRSFGQSPILVL